VLKDEPGKKKGYNGSERLLYQGRRDTGNISLPQSSASYSAFCNLK